MIITNYMPCKTIDNKNFKQKQLTTNTLNNSLSKDIFFKASSVYAPREIESCKNFLTSLRTFVVKKESIFKSAMDWTENPQNKGGLFIFDRDGTLTSTGFNDILLTEKQKSIKDDLLNFDSPQNTDDDIVCLGKKISGLYESRNSHLGKALCPAIDLIKNLEKNNIFYKIVTGNTSSPKVVEDHLIEEGFLNLEKGFPKEYLGVETNVRQKQKLFQQIEEEHKGKPIAYIGDSYMDFPYVDNYNPERPETLFKGPNSFYLPYAY